MFKEHALVWELVSAQTAAVATRGRHISPFSRRRAHVMYGQFHSLEWAMLTGGKDARGSPSEQTVELGVQDTVDAAIRAVEACFGATATTTRPAALVALERAACRAILVGSVDSRETVAALTNWNITANKRLQPQVCECFELDV